MLRSITVRQCSADAQCYIVACSASQCAVQIGTDFVVVALRAPSRNVTGNDKWHHISRCRLSQLAARRYVKDQHAASGSQQVCTKHIKKI
jgi:hypothetical protein